MDGLLNISFEEYTAITISFPQKAEQDRIADYFCNLDHLITLHQKKCLEWKKRDFTSASISWEQRKAIDIADYSKGNGYSKGDLIDVGTPIILYGRLYTKYQFAISEVDTFAVPRNGAVYSQGNEVIVPASGETAEDIARASAVEKSGVLLGGDLNILRPFDFITPLFLALAISNGEPQKELAKKSQGKSVVHIHNTDIQEVTIAYPSKIEQDRIVSVFRQLDRFITLHQRKLELLKRLRNSLVDRCFIGEKYTMSKLILYHGSPNRVLVSKFGFGEDRHDYGRGFYLTENLELAKEWAVCRPDETNGWVHKYELEMEGLNILDFQKYDVLSWLAELMKHRDAADSRRYKMLAQKFIEKYGIDTCGYDVITGWRANASYFYIAKEFVRDNIDIEILEKLLSLGGLGIQFCIKSERAFAQLSEVEQDIMSVDYSEFNDRYNSGTTICRAARS